MVRKGLSYPLQIVNGTLKTSEGSRLDVEATLQVLETLPRERITRPNYGTPPYLFTSVINATLIAARTKIALEEQIAEVKSFEVTSEINAEGQVFTDIFIESVDSQEKLSLRITE